MGRGRRDAAAVGRIVAVRGNATLATWRRGSACNLVNGTDGTVFPPFLRGTAALPIYTSASCRSLYLRHRADDNLGGVPLMRFVIDADMLASGRDYPPNRCFCVVPPTEPVDPEDEVSYQSFGATRALAYMLQSALRLCSQEESQRANKPTIEEQELAACLPQGAMDLSPCSGRDCWSGCKLQFQACLGDSPQINNSSARFSCYLNVPTLLPG